MKPYFNTKQEALAHTQALLSSIGDGVIATGDDARIQYVNDPALKLLGYKKSELINAWFPKKICAVTAKGKPVDLINRPIAKAVLRGTAVTERSFYLTKAGLSLPISITVAPIIIKGRPIGAIETFRDITKELNEELMKDEFISIASHQLRTPLSAIKIHAEILATLLDDSLSHKQQDAVANIVSASYRMVELIDSLLNIARLDAGKRDITREKVDINKVVRESLDEVISQHIGDHATILVKPLSQPCYVISDRILLNEVFTNLISNALKYTPSTGKITIAINNTRGYTRLSVVDTGHGIPESETQYIYSRFYRGSNIYRFDTSGTGLGLYLVKKIVDMLGAKIEFKSRLNKGTRFTVSLQSDC